MKLGEKGKKGKPTSFEGEVQCYGTKGVQTLFTHLQYMKKLTQLWVIYLDEWNKTNMFLKQCYEQCALEKSQGNC